MNGNMWTYISNKRRYKYFLCLVLFLYSCSQRNYQEPIQKLQKNTNAAVVAISTYYSELNPYERELYFRERIFDPTLDVLLTDSSGDTTVLLNNPFDQKSIQARIALIQNIALYSEKLSELAGNDSPERFKSNIKELELNFTKLQATFNDLSNKKDEEAKDYAGPIGSIIGVIGRAGIERKRDNALKQSIIESNEPITKILKFLERDLDKYVQPLRNTGEMQKLSEMTNYYNMNSEKMSLYERQYLLNEINLTAEKIKLVNNTRPSNVVKGIRSTHQALVSVAIATGKPNFGALMSALNEYENEVQELVKAVAKLKES